MTDRGASSAGRPRALERGRSLHLAVLRDRRELGPLDDASVIPLPAPEECFTEARGRMGTPGHPCPYLSCKWHLKTDTQRKGGKAPPTVYLNRPREAIEDATHTCARWVAEFAASRGVGVSSAAVGALLGLSASAIDRTTALALHKLGLSTEARKALLAAGGNNRDAENAETNSHLIGLDALAPGAVRSADCEQHSNASPTSGARGRRSARSPAPPYRSARKRKPTKNA